MFQLSPLKKFRTKHHLLHTTSQSSCSKMATPKWKKWMKRRKRHHAWKHDWSGNWLSSWIKKKKEKGFFLFSFVLEIWTFIVHFITILKWLARSIYGEGEAVHTVAKTKNLCWKGTLNILTEFKFTILQNILLNNLWQWMIQTWMVFVEKPGIFVYRHWGLVNLLP